MGGRNPFNWKSCRAIDTPVHDDVDNPQGVVDIGEYVSDQSVFVGVAGGRRIPVA
ncbi:uncharacterized protein RAG0_13021 [Rhynchosporium agropyri]|uniref:Uncharacterized protein n=1 Tax=Rhynchosporium agropyri TaxID=914238 RepID=A0A1E1LAR3_9HELO|nr:uncharacterized protein RAG0_13021 [Rhynchosporium agropyri]